MHRQEGMQFILYLLKLSGWPVMVVEQVPLPYSVVVLKSLQMFSINNFSCFRGNIPNGDVKEGEVVSGYLPPCPVKGTGFHRFVFCLFNQNARCNFEEIYRTHCSRFSFNKFT